MKTGFEKWFQGFKKWLKHFEKCFDAKACFKVKSSSIKYNVYSTVIEMNIPP